MFRPSLLAGLLLVPGLCCAPAAAEVQLPAIYSDGMVLQRNVPLPIRGLAAPNELVRVVLSRGNSKVAAPEVRANADGAWQATLPAQKEGAPGEISVQGTNTLLLKDVLFGEVWLGSGQSNMAWTVKLAAHAEEEIAAAHFPQIRVFGSPFASRGTPQNNVVAGKWQAVSPQTVPHFSAVAYFFARDIHQRLKVPVGVISAAAGGTAIESWVNQSSITGDATLKDLVATYEARARSFKPHLPEAGWITENTATENWKAIPVPGEWEKAGVGLDKLDGAVWFRREVTLPEGWAGQPLSLNLAPIDDGDITYFNGVQVGSMNVDTPNSWTTPRSYTVPGHLVKGGTNHLAVRVTDQLGGGGFSGTPEQMWVARSANPDDKVSLAGTWQFRVAEEWPQVGLPTSLYNGMVAPWAGYPLAGVLWYQGESNAGNARRYRALLPALVRGWRLAWSNPNLPFLVVQLPNFGAPKTEPATSNWAEFRETQALVARDTDGVHLAVTLDLGEAKDIHPKNKQDVAKRLALLARAHIYGEHVLHGGPVCREARLEGDTYTLTFEHGGAGLVARPEGTREVTGFALAGRDKVFHFATATLTGDTVVVKSDKVSAPVELRYAWADSPSFNLYNTAGLPAPPFRVVGGTILPGKRPVPSPEVGAQLR